MKITEGYMPYLGYQTYYRIVSDETCINTPLVLLHGGPGSGHDYFEVLDRLAEETKRPIISYDQLGCGNSFVEDRDDLWKSETWVNELMALREYLGLKEIHLLGQSWGGMLAITYLIEKKPEGIRSVILSSTLPSSQLWGKEQHRLISFMSEEDQKAIRITEETGNYESEAYQKANDHFMILHCNGPITENDPECVRRPHKSGRRSYEVAWGPNEFTPSGTLKDYNYIDRLNEITVPTLIFSGTNDLCTPLIAKTMYDGIPDARWHLFDGARHSCYWECNDEYCRILKDWFTEKD